MTPKQQAEEEIKQLIVDMYNDEFSWAAKIFKKFLKVERVMVYARRIMDISEKYVQAKVDEHANLPH